MNSEKDLEFICVSWMPLFLEEWRLVALSFRKHNMFYCLHLFCGFGCMCEGVESRLHTQVNFLQTTEMLQLNYLYFFPNRKLCQPLDKGLFREPIRKRKKNSLFFGLVTQGFEIHS